MVEKIKHPIVPRKNYKYPVKIAMRDAPRRLPDQFFRCAPGGCPRLRPILVTDVTSMGRIQSHPPLGTQSGPGSWLFK